VGWFGLLFALSHLLPLPVTTANTMATIARISACILANFSICSPWTP